MWLTLSVHITVSCLLPVPSALYPRWGKVHDPYALTISSFSLNGVVHYKVISDFQSLRQARTFVPGSNPQQKGPCRPQGGFAINCAMDAPIERRPTAQSPGEKE
ncbi:hypothetical protein PoB_005926300 [Plakobranchus ocellatus]|uniref:Uncharacterized protein n=1 Tax=Plakobranchus ocellatus TaxID=259542 RepID=A0AAV4CMX8_9GAST|nr:hypothetical protein PoB_005926300 [Plakobranchus ocellatus]